MCECACTSKTRCASVPAACSVHKGVWIERVSKRPVRVCLHTCAWPRVAFCSLSRSSCVQESSTLSTLLRARSLGLLLTLATCVVRVVNCHGSFATATCVTCGHTCHGSLIEQDILNQRIARCPICPPICPPAQMSVEAGASINGVRAREGVDARKAAGRGGDEGDGGAAGGGEESGWASTQDRHLLEQARLPASHRVMKPDIVSAMDVRLHDSMSSSDMSCHGVMKPDMNQVMKPDMSCHGVMPHMNQVMKPDMNHQSHGVMKPDMNEALSDIVASSHGVMKPDIVFFNEALPGSFFGWLGSDLETLDLLLVIGTSLRVAPVSDIVSKVDAHVPAILINREVRRRIHVSRHM